MAYETSVLRGELQQDRVAEDDYQSFSAALGASARGRAFLTEYARRNRHTDTAVVLAALDRLEAVARSQKAAPEAERIRQDLRALLDTLYSARPQIDQSPGAIKAATLSALIEFVQARIEALVAPAAAPSVRGFLSPVPESDEPELPIPRPGASAQPSIALVHAIAPPSDSAPAAARPAPDPFVLSLDPRIGSVFGPVFGGEASDAPPRPANVIPEIDFIDALFERAQAKAARDAAEQAATALTQAPPPPAPVIAPPPSAAVLPPLDLSSIETMVPVAAQLPETTADAGETAQAVAQAVAFGETIDLTDSISDNDIDAATIARAEALVRATNATADAIDNIVAAAAALMAEQAAAAAAMAETAIVETAIVDTVAVETVVAETLIVETPIAEIAFGDSSQAAPVEAGLPEVGFADAAPPETATAETETGIAPAIGDVTTPAATVEPPAVHAESQTQNDVAVIDDGLSNALAAAPSAQMIHNPPANAVAEPARHVRDDALAAIMALSEEERLALFT